MMRLSQTVIPIAEKLFLVRIIQPEKTVSDFSTPDVIQIHSPVVDDFRTAYNRVRALGKM